MNFDIKEIVSTFTVMFIIIDVLGAIPIIMNLRAKGDVIHPVRTTLVSTAILVLFFFFGVWFLDFFGLNIESFAVAGSFVLFIFALEMLLDVEIFRNKGPEGSSSIVPLAFPLFAGPGVFTALLSLQSEYAPENLMVALLLNMVCIFIGLKFTPFIEKLIGESGVYITRKFFGIIVLATAVKLFTGNIGALITMVK